MRVFPGAVRRERKPDSTNSTNSTEYRTRGVGCIGRMGKGSHSIQPAAKFPRSYPVCVHGAPRTIRHSCLLRSKSCGLVKIYAKCPKYIDIIAI